EGVRKPGSVGIPLPDVDCRIVDIETGTREVSQGEAGELCLRGPNIMEGYWQRPEETAAVIRDGWLRTGDIVRMDEGGDLYVASSRPKNPASPSCPSRARDDVQEPALRLSRSSIWFWPFKISICCADI